MVSAQRSQRERLEGLISDLVSELGQLKSRVARDRAEREDIAARAKRAFARLSAARRDLSELRPE